MAPQAPEAPLLELAVCVTAPDESPSHLDAEHADLRLVGGARLGARRGAQRVTFSVPEPVPSDELAHPYLAPAAALFWQWAESEALHAGVVEVGEGAVLVFGEKQSGKSTTLASLAMEHGCAVLADDLAVIRDGRALAGPRSLDLRPGAEKTGGAQARGGSRIRVDLGAVPGSLPVVGACVLTWGRQDEVQKVPVRERLTVLAAQRTYPLPGDPRALLELAAQPMFRLTRRWEPNERSASAGALLRCFA